MNISLVIPVRDEGESLARLLESISKQTRPPEEIIFVDAGSTDKTDDIITGYEDDRLKFRLISIGPAYPGTARNAGVRESAHEFIAFTDGGIELDKNWLKELGRSMEEDGTADIVYGNYMPRTDTLFKQCLSLAVVPPPTLKSEGTMRSHFIASSLVKKSIWKTIGGFPDFRASEDRVFMEKVGRSGYKVKYNPKALVVWDIPGNIENVFARFYNYSYHDLKAGRAYDWHMPVLRMYLIVLFFIYAGFFISPYLFLPPLLGFVFRVIKKIYVNRDEPYFKLSSVPAYLIITGFLIFLIDIAMLAGWIKYLLKRP